MRAIKFRQWSGDRFFTWGLVDDGFGMHFKSPSSGKGFNPINSEHQQFTGLNDKNGVEIYEGDICVWYINDIERVGEIYYHDQSFEMRSPSMGYIGWDANRGEIEVIGDIHETPELLK